jgi:hypothetical protein
MKGPFIFTAVFSISLLVFLMNTSANWLEAQPTPPDQKFAVVDNYKGCEVVQYSPTNAARYYYFLHCEK